MIIRRYFAARARVYVCVCVWQDMVHTWRRHTPTWYTCEYRSTCRIDLRKTGNKKVKKRCCEKSVSSFNCRNPVIRLLKRVRARVANRSGRDSTNPASESSCLAVAFASFASSRCPWGNKDNRPRLQIIDAVRTNSGGNRRPLFAERKM